MIKRIVRILAALVLLAAVGAALWYFLLKEQQAVDHQLVLYGNVDIRQVELAFNASERIAEILVEEGAAVERGQLLAVLDERRLQQAVKRVEAELAVRRQELSRLERGSREEEIRKVKAEVAAARIEAENAEKTYQRLRPLAEKELASQEQADDAKARAEAGRARLKMAEETQNLVLAGPRQEDIAAASARLAAMQAELEIARKNLSDAKLTSPGAAIVQNRILQPGDMAFPQKPVFTLAMNNPVWIRAYVPQQDLGKISPGMQALIQTDSYPDKRYTGWIGYISPTAEFTPKSVETTEVRTDLVYQVRVFACNPQHELRLGMPATVFVDLEQPREQADGIPACTEP